MIREHNGQASLWRRMTNGMKAIQVFNVWEHVLHDRLVISLFCQYLCSGRHKLDELESIVSTFYLERKSTAAEMYAAITEYLPLYYNVSVSIHSQAGHCNIVCSGLGYSYALQCKIWNVEFNSCIDHLPEDGW